MSVPFTVCKRQTKHIAPLPANLLAAEHVSDTAIIPMQMLTAPYMARSITPESISKLQALYAPHAVEAQAISPPWERSPRRYTFWLEEGLSVGGISFDESVVGGPSINPAQFSPGVIQWNAGETGSGVGWISVRRSHLV